ncbi:MAG: thioredoxin family protein [Saprospiraceae bacterium]|nr:thioredoxin family protein [Saprospiraceae bacterium]
MKQLLLFAVLFLGLSFTTDKPTGLGIGDTATDFSLKNVDGKMVSLADYKDAKGFIVIFTCNHCPFAQKYEDRIIELNDKYAKKGYPVIAIQPNDPALEPADSFTEMQARAKEKKYKFPYLMDEGQKVFPQFGATRTPHVFLLDKNKVVKYIGAIDDNAMSPESVKTKFLEDAIADLMAGKSVKTPTTKAVGCGIKTKA